MPDLSHLDYRNILNVLLNTLTGPRGAQGQPGGALMNHIARLMDKTLIAYAEARAELDRYVSEEHISSLVRAQDHLETCIDTLQRVVRMVERLRRLRAAPPIDKNRLPRQHERDSIRRMRVTIQHFDDITEDPESVTDAWMAVCSDRIELSGECITYAELARWIVQYHHVVRDVIAYVPDDGSPGGEVVASSAS